MSAQHNTPTLVLMGGDVLVLALITAAGFATHGELGSAGLRMLTTFVPLLAGWALLAPVAGLYNRDVTASPRQLYRPLVAGIFTGAMAAVLRGLWLNQPIQPVFAAVMAAVAALAAVAWRAVWAAIQTRQVRHG